jgi:Tol biopolymer transport system component/predicted Ser/Thr protein kinase
MIGQTISHYKILEKLGEGGMGVVYKAHDTKLDRTVALKFLPQSMAASEADRARFLQEARAAASLDNANICTIYGIEEYRPHDTAPDTGAQLFIAMAYVEGATLREKLPALTQKQAIDIAIQVADGLAAAHEKGVVHRDIKPENIMLRKDGVAQIMDFGLAKLRESSSKINRLTKQGSTVGTAGYMSPEQVQGMDADHRSDIFSFGVLLYELLTGQLPFRGVHETALAYEIVNVDPAPMSSVNAGIDPNLDAIVLECLEKEVNERAQSIKQVAVDLKRYKRESSRQRVSRITAARPAMQPGSAPSGMAPAGGSRVATGYHPAGVPSGIGENPSGVAAFPAAGGKKLYQALAAIGALLAMTFLFLWSPWKATTPSPTGVVRATIALEKGYELNLNWNGSPVDISPDGKMIAYSGFSRDSGRTGIFLRSLDKFETRLIPDVLSSTVKFSPDGKWIYFIWGGSLSKVSIEGGGAVRVTGAENPRGIAWGPDGSLYLAAGQVGGVVKISPSGDSVETVTKPDNAQGEVSHRFPSILPGGKAMLLTVKYKTTATFDDAAIVAVNMETGEKKTLIKGGSHASYVPTGHIVYVRGGSLYAVPFDAATMSVTGPTRELFPGGMLLEESGTASYGFSNNGTLVYAPGGPAPSTMYTVDWLSLDGKTTPLVTSPASYGSLSLSPDRTKLALTINAANNDVWTYNIARPTMQRLTFGGGNHGDPIWTPDGNRVAYWAEKDGEVGIYWRTWNGAGKEEKLLEEKGMKLFTACFSPDGKTMLFYRVEDNKSDVWALSMDTLGTPWPVVQTPFDEINVTISPDGRWLAYGSTETGKPETYVVPFPGGEGKWQIGGAVECYWNRDGSELYYLDSQGILYAVPIRSGASFDPGTPRRIADYGGIKIKITGVSFDPAGMRWAVIRELPGVSAPTTINLVTGWFDELHAMGDGPKE